MIRSEAEERAARALGRAKWPVRRYRLGEEPGDDLSATTTMAERLAMMWPLALDGFAMAGRPIPDYERSAAPGRLQRQGPLLEDDE